MNIWTLVISALVVFLLLFVLNFENMYNYYTYVAPIQNVDLFDALLSHPDPFEIDGRYTVPIHDIKYVEKNNTITVTFGGGIFSDRHGGIPAFSYVKNFQVNQTFVFLCLEKQDSTFLWFYKYLGVKSVHGEPRIILWHYEGNTHRLMPCNYPDVIAHSIDLVDNDHGKTFHLWADRYGLQPLH